jgi:predicted esterase
MAKRSEEFTDLLVQRGVLTSDQVEEAVRLAQTSGSAVEDAIIQRGFASPMKVLSALAEFELLTEARAKRSSLTPRLVARPMPPSEVGLQSLSRDTGKPAILYVPACYVASRPAPFALMLHGGGGNPGSIIRHALEFAERKGIIVLAPASLGRTWDMFLSGFGPDVERIDRLLQEVFSRYLIDPARLAIAGFSDGASYALSVGLANGDLFTHILAYSPGRYIERGNQTGTPRIFLSHGVGDETLPVGNCSRRVVSRLKEAGYTVVYEEFDGPHTLPPEIANQALDWFTSLD